MPTIICDEKQFVFIHIPKTAGTTVGRQLRSILPNDASFAYGVGDPPPGLGVFYNDHRTLQQIEITAPEAIDKIRNYTSIAICREPISRFRSALAQFLKNTKGLSIAELDQRDLESLVDSVIHDLRQGEIRTKPMTFFRRQSEYIFLRDEQLVHHIFDMRKLDRMAQFVKAGIGVTLDTRTSQRASGSYAVKRHFEMHPVIRALKPVTKPMILKPLARSATPGSLLDRLQNAAGRDRMSRLIEQRVSEVLTAPERRAFLEDYYAPDFELVARASTDSPANSESDVAQGCEGRMC